VVHQLDPNTTRALWPDTQHQAALSRAVVADRPAQHQMAGLDRVEDRALRGRAHAPEFLEAKYRTVASKTKAL
jgi:hypothetical protein